LVEHVQIPIRNAVNLLRRWILWTAERFRIGDEAFHIILASVIGALVGLGAVAFLLLIRFFQNLFFGTVFPALGSRQYLIFLLPALGGLLIGPLIKYFPRETKGEGIPEAMEAVALQGGIIRLRKVALRTVAAAVTIGSGGSVGRMAPTAQLGAAVGSAVGQFLRVSGERMRSLVGCGAAGGIAAVFNAPIGGVFFALEVLLGDFSKQTFAPIVISAVLATAVSRAILGDTLFFHVPPFTLGSGIQILLCGLLGALCGAAAILLIKTLDSAEERFAGSRVPSWLQPALGGAMVGVIAILFPQVLGTDETALNAAVHGALPWFLLFWIALLKIVATSLSLGSGGTGGILGPSVFIGGMIGAAAGTLANILLPDGAGMVGGYALIGMAAFLAPVVGAPLTAILILFEMTGDYAIILPLLVAVIVSMLVAGRFSRFSLYTHQLHRRGIDLVRGREEGVLRSLRVRDVMRWEVQTVSPDAPFEALVARFFETPVEYLYVTGEGRALLGVISFMDIRPHIKEEGLSHLVRARDIATLDPVSVTPGENLFDALVKLGYKNVANLPVISDPHSRQLIGILRHKDILEAYQRRIVTTEREKTEEPAPHPEGGAAHGSADRSPEKPAGRGPA
jgi:chloride channel protein, CIC family